MNGTQVRLKDVIRLSPGPISAARGIKIISQGEADRILNASPKERREMVEDALGLKLYQHKKVESERSLKRRAARVVFHFPVPFSIFSTWRAKEIQIAERFSRRTDLFGLLDGCPVSSSFRSLLDLFVLIRASSRARSSTISRRFLGRRIQNAVCFALRK